VARRAFSGRLIQQQAETRRGAMASVLAFEPTLILMFVGQRSIVKRLTLGSQNQSNSR
jgi:hypothetical protein